MLRAFRYARVAYPKISKSQRAAGMSDLRGTRVQDDGRLAFVFALELLCVTDGDVVDLHLERGSAHRPPRPDRTRQLLVRAVRAAAVRAGVVRGHAVVRTVVVGGRLGDRLLGPAGRTQLVTEERQRRVRRVARGVGAYPVADVARLRSRRQRNRIEDPPGFTISRVRERE